MDIFVISEKYVNLQSNKFKIVNNIIKDILKVNDKISKSLDVFVIL